MYHTFEHAGLTLSVHVHTQRLCVCVLERELDGVHTPVFCYVQLARKWNLMLCQMLTDSQKPCSCGEREERGKEHEWRKKGCGEMR